MTKELRREFLKRGKIFFPAIPLILIMRGCSRESKTSPPYIPSPIETTSVSPISESSKKGRTWEIQSVDSMKETKDRILNPRSDDFIKRWADAAFELGVTHVAVDTPIDNPKDNASIDYTRRWINPLREHGLLIYHRHPILEMEGIYNTQRDPQADFIGIIEKYIQDNRDLFHSDDLFGIPEIANTGISGVNCSRECIFPSKDIFNMFLRTYTKIIRQVFTDIGLPGVRIGGFEGYDGFIVGGLNNKDWEGKSFLERETIDAFGNIIAIDHYPVHVSTMGNDLKVIQSVWPNAQLFIGEWGAIHGESPLEVRQCLEAIRNHTPQILGINYWHMGMGGKETLLNEDFSKRSNFYEVQAWYKGKR